MGPLSLLPPTVWTETDAGPLIILGAPHSYPERVYLIAGTFVDVSRVAAVLKESYDGDDWRFLANFPTPIEEGTVMVEFKRRYTYLRIFFEITASGDEPAVPLAAVFVRDSR